MKKLSISLLVAFAVVATVSAICGQKTDSQKEAERIWEQAIEAKGGRDKLYAVENMVVSSRIPVNVGLFKKIEVQLEQFFVFPSKLWIWDDERGTDFGLTLEQIDLEKDFKYYLVPSDTSNSLRKGEITPRAKQFFFNAQLLFLMETKWQKPKLLAARTETLGSKKYDVVEVLIDHERRVFYFDQKTHLPMRVINHYSGPFGEKTIDFVYKLEKYKVIDGIQFPTVVTGRTLNGSTEYLNFQINVEYDKELFNHPPSAEAGPEAWKLKK